MMVLILMGVCGSGKTTIGMMLAERLGWRFADGDDYHPEANQRKMADAIPLDDTDRIPWLETLHQNIQAWVRRNENTILACSALKESYRNHLQGELRTPQVQFALLQAPRTILAQRLKERSHAYMNPALLDSQLATLDQPVDAWIISVSGAPEQACEEILARLHKVLPAL